MKAVLADVDADRRHSLGRFATRKVQVMDDIGPGAKQIGEIKGAILGNESGPALAGVPATGPKVKVVGELYIAEAAAAYKTLASMPEPGSPGAWRSRSWAAPTQRWTRAISRTGIPFAFAPCNCP